MAGSDGNHNEITGGNFFSAVIQARNIGAVTVQLPTQIPVALSGLPPASAAFVGRDHDLNTLIETLAPGAATRSDTQTLGHSMPATTVTAVRGLAGVGKTELAVQAARTALADDWFPGGVLFVDLFGYDPARYLDPAPALEGFLRALGIADEHIPPTLQERARLYASILSAYAGQDRRILVVVDNASTHEQARPLLPTDGTSAAIVTSRDSLGLISAQLLDLKALTPRDAAAMLDQVLQTARPGDTRIVDHPDAARSIARLCGSLPLALQIVAALLADDPGRPLTAMVSELQNEQTRLKELTYSDIAVQAAFDLSYLRLSPDHARFFRLLPLNPGPDISIRAAAKLADTDPATARRGLEALARAHLLERGIRYGRWRMHDLVRLHADQHGLTHAEPDGRSEAFTRLLEHYVATAAAANAHLDFQVTAPASLGFTDREQALKWLDIEYPNLIAAIYAAANTGHHAVARDLSYAIWDFMYLRQRFADWIAMSTISCESARHLNDRHGEASALNSLGIAYRRVRRFEEAIIAFTDAVEIFHQVGNRHGEAMALNSLGIALRRIRRLEESVTTLQNAAKIFQELDDRNGEGLALTNLGSALAEQQRHDDAATVLQHASKAFRSVGDRGGEAQALGNLGNVLRRIGRFQDAVDTLQNAVQIFREIDDLNNEGQALNNLGVALAELGRHDGAITILQRATKIFRDMDDLHNEGLALSNLGAALIKAGEFDDAITALQKSAKVFRETSDKENEVNALVNLETARKAKYRPL